MPNIEIPDNPEFNIQMRKLEETDPAAAELFNAMFLQLLENFASIINGTVKVGNADKLDGNDSTLFALKTDLTPLAKTSDLEAYAKVASLSVYAKVADLSIYAKSADLSSYATKNDLGVYAKTSDLSSYAKTSDLSSYATKSELSSYATTAALSSYAKTADLSVYAKTSALGSYLPLSGGNITGNLTIGSQQVLHKGNSRPVVISATAPSDTSALWIQ